MSRSKISINKRSQNVRLAADMRFPKTVELVTVRAIDNERISSPVKSSWDSFFLGDKQVSDDFLTERADLCQSEREAF